MCVAILLCLLCLLLQERILALDEDEFTAGAVQDTVEAIIGSQKQSPNI